MTAKISGQTVLRKADAVVGAYRQTVLSDRDRDLFIALLDNPPAPNDALQQAAKEYKEGRIEGDACRWNR